MIGFGVSRCGTRLGDAQSHAFCCALPEATKGHYSVRDATLSLAHLADPATTAETRGLIPSRPLLRPADFLCSAAFPGRLTALDIGVCSPDAAGAGDDCCDAMYNRKRNDYKHVLDELENQEKILYRPLVWSMWGREHPETTFALTSMARADARKHGLASHLPVLRRVRSAIGVQLMRRAVRMLHACLPRETVVDEFLANVSVGHSLVPLNRGIVHSHVGFDARP